MTNTVITRAELLAVGLETLLEVSRQAGTTAKHQEWAARLSAVADYLAAEDRLRPEFQVPRSERLRELKRAIGRLERIAAGRKPRANAITLTDSAVRDVRLVWSDFSPGLLEVVTAEQAASLAANLRRTVRRLAPPPPDEADRALQAKGVPLPVVGTHWFYGSAKARRGGDSALRDAAADLLDLLNEAKGQLPGTLQPETTSGPWHALLRTIAEVAGRAAKGGAEDRRAALRAVREILKRGD
jgi:hypothetical protein